MQDFKELNMKEPNKQTNPNLSAPKLKHGLFTKNRFWNLVFLFDIPAELCLCGIFDSLVPLIAVPFTIIMFGLITFDNTAIENKDPIAVKALKYAAAIWFCNLIIGNSCLFLNIKPTFNGFIVPGFSSIYFAIALNVFFIFFIPILILCYANISLSGCIQADNNYSKSYHPTVSSSSTKRMAELNQRSSDLRTLRSNSWYAGNAFHNKR